MLLNLENFGEKTLNKIAEMALAPRLGKADRLTVQVKTDPNLLAQGILESLAIDGRGLLMHPCLRLQEMRIDLQSVAVSPFKALMGNIELTRPSQGTVRVVLNEKDIETAYRSISPRIEGVICRVRPTGEIDLRSRVRSISGDEAKTFDLVLSPRTNTTGEKMSVDIAGLENLPPELAREITERTREIFQLKSFSVDGMTLSIESIAPGEGKLTLQGRAGITRFPAG